MCPKAEIAKGQAVAEDRRSFRIKNLKRIRLPVRRATDYMLHAHAVVTRLPYSCYPTSQTSISNPKGNPIDARWAGLRGCQRRTIEPLAAKPPVLFLNRTHVVVVVVVVTL